MFLDYWNTLTALWLTRMCYEQVSFSPPIQMFFLCHLAWGIPRILNEMSNRVLMALATQAMRNNLLNLNYFMMSEHSCAIYAFCKISFMFSSSWHHWWHICGLIAILLLMIKTQRKAYTCIPGWPQTYSAAEDDLELYGLPAPTFPVVEL